MSEKSEVLFLVDDDSIYLKSIEHYFNQKLGDKFTIKAFSTGEECLSNLYLRPSIIVLDYYLDGVKKEAINGLDVLKKIKETKFETDVIMLSGADNLEIANNCIGNGAYDFVIKSETALVKTRNIIENIYKSLNQRNKLKSQKKWLTIVSVILLINYIIIFFIHKFYPDLFLR